MTLAKALKHALKSALLSAADVWLMQILARLAPANRAAPVAAAPNSSRRIVVLAPAIHGNTGDAAMVEAYMQRLRQTLPDAAITLIVFTDAGRAHYAYLGVETASLQGFLGFAPRLRAVRAITSLISTASDFVILGADVLDGAYGDSHSIRRLYLGVLARRAGVAVSVVGFSFSNHASLRVTAFTAAHCSNFAMICREPVSAARVAAAIGRPVPSGADIAFMLPMPDVPSAAATPAIASADAWRAEGRRMVVFNANPVGLANAVPGIDIAACARASAEALRLIGAASPCGFVLATHDTRTGVSGYLAQVLALLPADQPAILLHGMVRPGDFKLLCAKADLTLTGRMHMGIASLGVGTPALFQDYQGKIDGLLGLFDLPELKFTAEDVLVPERLAAKALDLIARKPALSAQINARLPTIRALSARNIDIVGNGTARLDICGTGL